MQFAVFPFGLFFPDFGSDSDFFQEIGLEMVQIYTPKSSFGMKWKKERKKLFNDMLYV